MPDLSFEVCGARVVADTAIPAIALEMRISNRPLEQVIQTVVLRCQVQIESARRRYTAGEEEKLRDLFGERARWGQTLRPMLWANVATTVPAFTGATTAALDLPCTFDFHVSATKYLHALEENAVPLALLFSGTVFYHSPDGRLQAGPIPWNSEAHYALPAGLWKESIDRHYGETAWLTLRRDAFERLYEFKVREGAATFEEAIERLLDARKETAVL